MASALNRNDEVPNQELALRIVKNDDVEAIKELVDNLKNKSKDIQKDCIKVLYEVGEKKPALIAGYVNVFFELLKNKNNRLQWGGMTALSSITLHDPAAIVEQLVKIIDAADNGSVITKDQAVAILIKLGSMDKYAEDAFSLLVEQLKSCPTNQLPMYAENAKPIVNEQNKEFFINTLSSRLNEIEKESKRKRVEKVIKQVSK
ncbi:hypothetical protein D3C78_1305040 [compost metagenome]